METVQIQMLRKPTGPINSLGWLSVVDQRLELGPQVSLTDYSQAVGPRCGQGYIKYYESIILADDSFDPLGLGEQASVQNWSRPRGFRTLSVQDHLSSAYG